MIVAMELNSEECGHLYWSCMWSRVDLRSDTKETCVLEKIGLLAQNLLTILSSKVNMISIFLEGGGYVEI